MLLMAAISSLAIAAADPWYEEGGNYIPTTRIRVTLTNTLDIARNMTVIDPNPETIDRERTTLDFAGIAFVVRDSYRPEFREIRSFQGNYTFRIPRTNDLTYEYLIAAAWSEGPIAKTPEAFTEYVKATAREYNNPVVVSGLELQTKQQGYRPVEYWGGEDVHIKR